MKDKKNLLAGAVRIGISGWTFAPWRGTFYPEGLVQKKELEYASGVFSSIEVNGTFYGLQKPKSFASWYEQTPEGFVFSLKAPKFITHIRRLRKVEGAVANFMLSGVLRLNEKLGPVLWQFPPTMKFDAEVFEAFLAQLPHSTKAAVGMAGKCDLEKDRVWDHVDEDRPLRHAVEIRHESFANEVFVGMLRKHGVALVAADTGGNGPMLHDVTADFVYVRMHGPKALYPKGYTEAGLEEWAGKIRSWEKGADAVGVRVGPGAKKRARRDVYVYFDVEFKERSPFDAARLGVKLGLREKGLEEG